MNTINKLKELAKDNGHEQTHAIFLKNPIKVGSNKNGDVLCVSFHRNTNEFYERDELYLDVIFDFVPSDLYGRDCDFTAVRYHDNDNGKPSFLPDKISDDYPTTSDKVQMFDNALELVLAEIELEGQEWIAYQRELRIKGRAFHRKAIQNSYAKQEGKKFHDFTWEEHLEWLKVKGEIECLMYRRPLNHDFKRYCHMICLGEKEHTKRQKKQTKIFNKIFAKMDLGKK